MAADMLILYVCTKVSIWRDKWSRRQ